MTRKLLKFCFISGIIFFILGLSGWLVTKYIVTSQAKDKARAIVSSAYKKTSSTSEDQKLITLTRYVFNQFEQKDPHTVPLLKARGYITNHRLPTFIRLESGVIETHIHQGLCDNAARMLAFILKQEGFDSVQWNMVTNSGGHSALLVTLSDGRRALADPFYGYVTINQNRRLISPAEAKGLINKGASFEEIFLSLGNKRSSDFYKNIESMYMGAEGNDLIIESVIPKQTLVLGEIDGHYKDVKSAASKLNAMPYLYYIGHKYNREWVRVLKTEQPVKISMVLTDEVEEGVLIAEPKPSINGKILEWKLGAGENITFRDGLAKISLKRMNSFIPVDQITILPLEN